MNEYRRSGGTENNLIDKILTDALAKKGEKPLEFLSDIENFSRQSGVTPNQLRNLYDIVVGIESKNKDDARQKLAKLRIMLEYAWNRKTIKPNFYLPVKALIEDIMHSADEKRLEDFKETMEAIVAYSKNREK